MSILRLIKNTNRKYPEKNHAKQSARKRDTITLHLHKRNAQERNQGDSKKYKNKIGHTPSVTLATSMNHYPIRLHHVYDEMAMKCHVTNWPISTQHNNSKEKAEDTGHKNQKNKKNQHKDQKLDPSLPCRSSLFLSTEFSSCFSLYLLRS